MVKTLPSNAGCAGLIPGQGAKIPHASQPKNQNIKKKKQYCNKFYKDFKNGPHQKNLKKKIWGKFKAVIRESFKALNTYISKNKRIKIN